MITDDPVLIPAGTKGQVASEIAEAVYRSDGAGQIFKNKIYCFK